MKNIIQRIQNINIGGAAAICVDLCSSASQYLSPRLEPILTHLGAARETLSHHVDVWREAMAAERARPKRTPLAEAELAFLPAALEITERPAAPAARFTAFTIMGFFTISIAWASIGELDVVAVAAGRIIPSDRVQVIQPLETSIVRAIHVREGQRVAKDDVLIELEAAGAQSDLTRLTAEWSSARAETARLEALQAADPIAAFDPPADLPQHLALVQRSLLASQWREHQARLAAMEAEAAKRQAELRTIEAEIARLTRMEVAVKDRAERRRPLAEKGLVAQTDFARDEEALAEASGRRAVETARQAEIRAAISALASQRIQAEQEFRRDATAKLSEMKAKTASLGQDQAKAAERHRVQSLRAPLDGTAQQIDIHTVGGVVTPAQKLLVVVPADSALEIEAKVPNKDIAFIEVGQEVEIKVDAFPFTRYRTLPGTVDKVSLDTVLDEESKQHVFPIRVRLHATAMPVENGKLIPLSSGMTVVAEVKTGTRRPIEYVLAPLAQMAGESGRER